MAAPTSALRSRPAPRAIPAAEWIGELWRYRELLFFLAWRDVKIRYRQTLLGVIWAVIQPFFTMVAFAVLFGRIVGIPTDGIPAPVFYYAALLPWTYFSGTLTLCGNSLVGNASLITKVYFPRVILPASTAMVGLIDFAIGSLVLLGMLVYYRVPPTWKLLLWPLLSGLLMVFTIGLGMLLSALNVRYRDVKYAVPFVLQLLLFATPIIYPTSLLPPRIAALMSLNPLAGIIEALRASWVPGRMIDWPTLFVATVVTAVLFVLGAVYFWRAEGAFSDVV